MSAVIAVKADQVETSHVIDVGKSSIDSLIHVCFPPYIETPVPAPTT